MRRAGLIALVGGCMLVWAAPASALTLQPIAEPGTFDDPTYVTSDPTNPDRLFVTEQDGDLKLVEGGAVSEVIDLDEYGGLDTYGSSGEEGLLSVALSPDFAASGRLYLYYTNTSSNIQIDEFTLDGGAPTQRRVLEVAHGPASNHNGGQLQFGPDGLLYAGTGDGGGQGDPDDDAQDLGSLLGKILRIDPTGNIDDDYTIPASNPFVGVGGADDEIWSYGLRNPWRFSFDAVTGDLLIGDVGGGAWDEIDFDPAPDAGRGLNFGWDCREGPEEYTGPPGEPSPDCEQPFIDPIFAYEAGGTAVTGGYVVRDVGLGDLFGRYVYADYFDGEVRSFDPAFPSGDRSEGVSVDNLSSFGQDSACRLYVASQDEDTVYRLVGDQPSACGTAALPPGNPERCKGEAATVVATPGVRVSGTGRRDVVVGSGGSDDIRTRGGRDLVCAKGGNDDVRTGGGKDFVNGGGGADEVRGGGKKDKLKGAGGKDDLRGGGGKDKLKGGGGKDRLRGGGGKDKLKGGGGKDKLKGGGGRDKLKGGGGRDKLKGGGGRDRLNGGGGRDRCNGGGGRDRQRSC